MKWKIPIIAVVVLVVLIGIGVYISQAADEPTFDGDWVLSKGTPNCPVSLSFQKNVLTSKGSSGNQATGTIKKIKEDNYLFDMGFAKATLGLKLINDHSLNMKVDDENCNYTKKGGQ